MNQSEETYQLIEQYLQGNLAKDHPFVQKIKEDEELALEIEIQKMIPEAVIDYRLMSVDRLIAEKRSTFLKQQKTGWQKLIWLLPVALVAALFVYFSIENRKEEKSQIENKVSVEFDAISESTIAKPIESGVKVIANSKTISSKIYLTKNDQLSVLSEKVVANEVNSTNIGSNTKDAVVENKPVQLIEKEIIEKLVDPCLGVRIKVFVEEKRPCTGTNDGYLSLKDIRGDKDPYLFSIDKKHFQSETKFVSLKADEYDIWVKDANACEVLVYERYSLKSKNCISFSDHVFNPNITIWDVPINLEKAGELDVLNKNGERVFSSIFMKSEKIEWNGTSISGEQLLPGVYIFSIKYNDGAIEQGRITIAY